MEVCGGLLRHNNNCIHPPNIGVDVENVVSEPLLKSEVYLTKVAEGKILDERRQEIRFGVVAGGVFRFNLKGRVTLEGV